MPQGKNVVQRKDGESIVFAGVKFTYFIPRHGRVAVHMERVPRIIRGDGSIPVYRVDKGDLTELPWSA